MECHYFNFASNIQNAPKAPISAITSSMPKVATRQDYNFVPYARKLFPILCHNSSDTICYKNNNFGFPKGFPTFWAKKENYYSPVTIHPSLFTGTIHRYCSLRNFAYLRGAVPYIQSKCFLCLVQDFFLREDRKSVV